ncbi:MAG: immunity 8 family protein [Deltaproteobacteria bacterium]|nr:immunity 8 family protein [Deltaproteobacteria bacterium]
MSTKRFNVTGLTMINEEWGDEPDDFCIQLHCELKDGNPGGEAFVVTVMSPRVLARGLTEPNTVDWGRGCLFMRDYDASAVQEELQRFVDQGRAKDWTELSEYVGRFFDWI